MMPASSKAGGVCLAAPDVCNTPAPPAPPVPVPYPNTAQVAAALSTVSTVLIQNMDTVVEGSKIPSSNGDEAGCNGGVTSGVFMGEVAPKVFSSKVYAAGKKIVYATGVTAHNGSNANMPAGAQVAPSQVVVFVAE